MMTMKKTKKVVMTFFSIVLITIMILPYTALGFTQSVGTNASMIMPMGHEWITRLSVLELIGGDPIADKIKDPNDPRKKWTKGTGLAYNTDLSSAQAEVNRIKSISYSDDRYKSAYKFVYNGIIGERWVDLGGVNVVKAMTIDKYDCFDAVAQEPPEVQYDHFMRKPSDMDGAGGLTAAQSSKQRFIDYFVKAAMATPSDMKAYDGGGWSELNSVDKNYFLFGRAVHLFEDSFSLEHVVRIPDDNYLKIRQVKSYLCAFGSEQHNHSKTAILDYTSGDVIWKPGTQLNPTWTSYIPSNMKTNALVSIEATKDLWAAFIRTMATPIAQREAVAKAEATTLANNWLSFDDKEVSSWYNEASHRDGTYVQNSTGGPGNTQSACMLNVDKNSGGSQSKKLAELLNAQKQCLYNIIPNEGYSDLYDTSMHMYYSWGWKYPNSTRWDEAPAGWQIPTNIPADSGKQLRIKSVMNNKYMTAPDGIGNNNWVYVKDGTPLDFVQIGGADNGYYRAVQNADLFLSYTWDTGAVKLYNSPSQANYKLEPKNNITLIKNLYHNKYMWLYSKYQSPYVDKDGNPNNVNAQWIIEYNH